MKRFLQWVMAAALIGGASVFTACTNDDNPVKPQREPKMVLVGMDVTGTHYYGDATYTYTYDDDLRLTHVYEVVPADNNLVARDLTITYSAGQVVMSGFIEGSNETDVCTLDAQGRIVEVVSTYSRSTEGGDTKTTVSNLTFTYDTEGHLQTETKDGAPITFYWENGDIVRIVVGTESSGYTIDMTPSDAPAQAFFHLLNYELDLGILCPQGLFGVLPLHMPASRVRTVIINGNPIHSSTTNHTYTVTDGRLTGIDDNYTFRWEMR